MEAEVVQTLTIQEVYEQAASCSEHVVPLSAAEISTAETLWAAGSCSCYPPTPMNQTCGGYCDTASFAIGRLADGRYVLIVESSDTTGHGCQCSGAVYIRETAAGVLMELDREEREALPANAMRLLTA
jgi:hypothetical protein